MNTISLMRPAAGQQVTVPSAKESTFVVDFSADQITLEKADDALVFHFDDGGSIRIADFYTEYTKDNTPDFEVDGQLVTGADFFNAFGPDLAPAEGAPASERSARYNEFSGSELADGVDHLDGVAYEAGSGSAFSDPGTHNSLFAAAVGQAPAPGGDGGGNGGENPQPPVQYSLKYSNVALLGADGQDNPEVHLDLARLGDDDVAGKTLAITNFDGSISYTGTANPDGTWTFDLDGYQAVYDPVKGELVFTLTDVASGATGSENYTLVFTDANGQQISHGVRVASTTDHNDMTSIAWKAPESADMQVTDQTWAGEVAHGAHFTNASTADIAAAIKLPHPPAGEGAYDAGSGREMHYQLTETSLTADGGQSRFEIDLKSGTSSLRISNNDNTAVLTGVEHHEPLPGFGDTGYGLGYTGADATEYSANVTATVAAQGTTGQNEIRVTGGDLIIQTVSDQPSFSADGAAYVSGAYATGGGHVSLEAQGVSVGAASVAAGSADKSAVITGVRADGGVLTNSGALGSTGGTTGFFVGREFDSSDVSITATTGDVQVSADMTGTAGFNTAVAGVAATDNGHVTIAAADGNVDITVNNRTESGSLDDSSSFFGVFSGVGLGGNDLPGEGDFADRYQQYQYTAGLYQQYLVDKFNESSNPYFTQGLDFDSNRGQQTIVDIQAEKDVNISLNLGARDGGFEAAGINAQLGDVNIASKNGDINVDVAMQGKHLSTGSGQEWVSALEISNGTADLKAELGDVNLSVNANGENIAVVHYNGATAFPAGGPYEYVPDAAVMASSSITGKNINLSGTVGADGSSAINHIIGINATHTHKKETFVISADERFTLNVAAVDNGGATSATGIYAGYAFYPDDDGGFFFNNAPSYVLALGAKEAEITAKVEAGTGLSADSRSVGIEASGRKFAIISDSEDNLWRDDGYGNKAPNTTALGYTIGYDFDAVNQLTVSAEGAWHNTGILADSVEFTTYGHLYQATSTVDIRADSLTVKATGNPEAGSTSSSTGIAAVEGSMVHIVSNDVTIEAADAHHSVGIHADGGGNVSISNAILGGTSDSGLKVIISAKVGTDLESMTNGIAIEAISGGHVQIVSRGDSGDYVEINGGIVTDGTGHVTIQTGGGDDIVKLNGAVDIGSSNGLTIDGGEGYNLLILSAPDHETFMQYYKSWFESGAIENNIHNFNEIILQGVDMGSDAYHLIQNSVGDLDILVRVIDAGTNVDLVANAYEHDFGSHDNHAGDNDLLFVRFNGAENPDQDGFDQTMHNIGDVGDGYESVLLDFVGSGDESLFAHSSSLDRLFDLKNSSHENTDIFVRTESSDSLVDSGWAASTETRVLNGETYTQYNNESGETMYVQMTIENCA
ncbi:MAG: hypothetical protein BCS36_07155 [Desulfovibrio sp. MES5]|uniref:hypothetical protein n=1 Tax=Desulfovibrio sp. MES5 TaxID=1899016 RepID=UPI000B9CB4B6|nr:hypothetical protein [Desulfovibrio sp. MES5]OXS29501.1 MAG: hypothetical protein BCS36_07155 [Desulfovibrio sp. MES5]